MSKTTTTKTTTTMMATIDMPSSEDVVGAAAMGDASTPAPAPTWSSFALGKKQDRVLEVESRVVRIKSMSAQDKFVTLTTKRWACLISIRDKIDVVVGEIKLYA